MTYRNLLGIALILAVVPACAAARAPAVSPDRSTPARAAQPQAVAAPASSDDGGSRPTDVLEKGGRVGLSAFALAGRVAWNGTRSVARAARGLVTSGMPGAKRGWEAGTAWTAEVARREAAKVRAEAQAKSPPP